MASVTYRGLAGQSAFRVPFVALSASDLSVTVGGVGAPFTFANDVVTLASPLASPADVLINDIGREERKFGEGVTEVGKTQQIVLDATIAAGGTATPLIDLGNFRPVAIVLPAAFTGTTVTPKTSYDGVNSNPIYDAAGTQKTINVGTGRRVILSPSDYLGARYVSLTSNATESADRVIKIIAEA
jgi:hypothetical protein